MQDILSHGKDREPRRWSRLVAPVAILVLAAAVTTYYATHRGQHARRSASAAVVQAPIRITGVADGSDGIAGPTLRWPSGDRLPVAGARPAWFWPATGRTRPIGGLPRDPAGYVFTRAAGGWAIMASPATGPAATPVAATPQPVYFLADQAGSAVRVGAADQAAPAATPDALWLTTAGTAWEVGPGKPPGPPRKLPTGYVIDRGTDRGLLLAPAEAGQAASADELWDPSTGRVARTFDRVIAVGPSEVAWTTGCAPQCRVLVLDLATGHRSVIGLAGASSAANAAFSPDGRWLAIEVSFFNAADDGATATQLDVASMPSGRLRLVPQTWTSSDALAGFGWPTGDGALAAELSFTTRLEVTSWHPGAARLAMAVVRPRQSTGLVVGQLAGSAWP